MKARERGGIIFKLIVILCILAFCGLIYSLRHPLLRFAGSLCIAEDSLSKSDALVVLSDDNFNADRSKRAAELFRSGWAPRIVASGRRLRPYATIAELIARDLTDRGIPKDAVVRFPESGDNTREEAQALASLATERKWNRLIIVTSNYHTRRARYIFRRVFPASVEIRVASARDSEYDPDHWWETRKGIKHFFTETAGMVVAIWELRHSDSSAGESLIWQAGPVSAFCGGDCLPSDLLSPWFIFPLYTPYHLYYLAPSHASSSLTDGSQLRGFGACVVEVSHVAQA